MTTLTKRMAEDLTDYLTGVGIKVRYMHSDISTIERAEIIKDLRMGEFDVLVGINLLREGLDIPEVALVAILDADKEGFLRSEMSLIQTIGRAARIMYADTVTKSMKKAIDETDRRRGIQQKFNEEHGIIPKTIKKDIRDIIESLKPIEDDTETAEENIINYEKTIAELQAKMVKAAENLEFEEAAALRDRIRKLEKEMSE